MIIKDPEEVVLGFNLIEWLVDREPAPKKAVRDFLRKIYEEISGKKVKAIPTDEEDAKDSEGDEVEEDDSDLHALLLDTTYDHFSVAEDGSILLIADSASDLLITEYGARELLSLLKTKLEDQVQKLNRLLK